MKLKILKMSLRNFKGMKELDIDFKGNDTNIFGGNATGKTTIYDAFLWVLFDKDSTGRKQFNIKTLDANNNPIHFLEHNVEITLNVDGQDIILKKVLKEKWVKKRGQEHQEFSGHETEYYINEVPTKKNEYEDYIENIIPEQVFKIITDPLYFNEKMNWQERKTMLFALLNQEDVDNNSIFVENEQFKELQEKLEGRTIEDYKKVLVQEKKKYKEKLEQVPARIDELNLTLKTDVNIDFEALEKEKADIQNKIAELDVKIKDVDAIVEKNVEKTNKLALKKMAQEQIKNELQNKNKQALIKQKQEIENKELELKNKIEHTENAIKLNNMDIERFNKTKQELYKEWDVVCGLKFEVNEEQFVCPTCKREFSAEDKEHKLQELQDNFNKNIQIQKENINKKGQEVNKQIDDKKNIIKDSETFITESKTKLEELGKQKQELIALIEAEENKVIDFTENEEYAKLTKEIEELEQDLKITNISNNTSITEEKNKLNERINEIQVKLNEKTTYEKAQARIEELEKEEQELAQHIADCEKMEYLIEEFIRVKTEKLEQAINSKFELVNIKLFSEQINGGLIETCEVVVNGVPFSDLNNAMKINAGLDIIRTLADNYDKHAPIFIDNAESVNELVKVNTQLIRLVVSKDKELRIEN